MILNGRNRGSKLSRIDILLLIDSRLPGESTIVISSLKYNLNPPICTIDGATNVTLEELDDFLKLNSTISVLVIADDNTTTMEALK